VICSSLVLHFAAVASGSINADTQLASITRQHAEIKADAELAGSNNT
jgi:hypothetical protein